jgi:hypothetical protein
MSLHSNLLEQMDVVLEYKDDMQEVQVARTQHLWIRFSFSETSTILHTRFNSRGLHCTVELFSRSLRQLRTFTRLTLLFVLVDG